MKKKSDVDQSESASESPEGLKDTEYRAETVRHKNKLTGRVFRADFN